MSGTTSIEWATHTWNPTKGCDRVSPGCDNCYAMTMAKRLKGMGSAEYQQDGDPRTSGPGFLAHESPNDLDWPLRKKKPMRVFVNSMSDLFHDNISDEYIARVFAVMALAPQHTFQVLTKRHGRMRSLLSSEAFEARVFNACEGEFEGYFGLPLPNVWLGVSVENQQWANIRIPALMETPAAVRFLSCEPLLGPIQLSRLHAHCPTHDFPGGFCTGGCPNLRIPDWIITGGESGPGARPAHPDWFRSLRDQSQALGIAFLHKQNGEWAAAGYGAHVNLDPETEWHRNDLRPQEHWFPTPAPDEPRLTHAIVQRVGKKAAGRELDGRTWDEYPGGGQ